MKTRLATLLVHQPHVRVLQGVSRQSRCHMRCSLAASRTTGPGPTSQMHGTTNLRCHIWRPVKKCTVTI